MHVLHSRLIFSLDWMQIHIGCVYINDGVLSREMPTVKQNLIWVID